MPFSFRKLTKLQLVAFSLLLLTAVTGLATSGRWLPKLKSNRAGAVSALATVAQTKQPAPKLEVEIVTLRPTGFDPATISRPKGAFFW